MAMNAVYDGPEDLPDTLPIFPLEGVLLLPRGHLPLNIFEPRYLLMIDDAFKSGQRLIGVVQALGSEKSRKPRLADVGCVGRITQLAETGDGRYVLTLSGITRFQIVQELRATTLYRRCRVEYARYTDDFQPDKGENVDRGALTQTLASYLDANNLEADWKEIQQASTEELVNALAMMSPWGAAEKQALLEAPTLKIRADLLVALAEMSVAREDSAHKSTLQ